MKIKTKIIAIIMLIILLSSNLLNIGAQVIAVSNDLVNESNKTDSAIEEIANKVTNEQELSNEIKPEELTNKAEISIKPENLSTVLVNKDVQIRVILDTSDATYALYKDPTIKIKLPSYISDIDIKSTDIIMNNGLKIKHVTKNKYEESITIIVELEGTQTEYTIGAEYKGTIIILNTDITVEKLTPTNNNKIQMTYINKNETLKNKEGKAETKLNFIAPMGVIAANSISNYAPKAEAVMSISTNTQIAQLETYTQKKIATVTGTIVNNYENKITNIKILGRLPSKNNKKIDSKEDLGSTFDAIINGKIEVTGIKNYKVYYSSKVDADENLENAENGWTESFSKSAKSYMIVADKDYEMDKQDIIEFSYDIQLPANLSYNNSTYEMYKVYYTNLSSVGNIDETKESAIIKATTGDGPELDVKLEALTDVVREGQIVGMKVTVANIGDMEVTDATLNIPKPEYASFVTYENTVGFSTLYLDKNIIQLGVIKPGQTITKIYYLRIDSSISNEEPKFENKVTIKSNEIKNEIPSNEYKTPIKTANIKLELIGNIENEEAIKNGQKLTFRIKVGKIKGLEEIKNITVKLPLLKGAIYKQAYIEQNGIKLTEGITYNRDNHTLQANIDSLGDMEKTIYIDLEGQNATGFDSIMAIANINEEEYYSNVLEYEYSKVNLQISELTSTPKYVKEGETITYKFDIKNIGNIEATSINVQSTLPKELLLTALNYKIGDKTQKISLSNDNIAKVTIPLIEVGKSATIIITARAKSLENKEEKQVQNSVSISADYFEQVQTNVATNIIEYNEEIHQNNTMDEPSYEEEDTPAISTYKITGTAWLDENKDGRRNESEKLLSNIPVILIDKSNNTIVSDINTYEPKRTTTSVDGTYEFTNIPAGEYLVVFLYDSANYSLTKYQNEGVEETFNSDVIDINIIFDGEKRIAGITDAIKVTNSNIRDIDIGLYVLEKFDLRLDKYISKITLTTPTIGTRVTTYNDESIAKVEILANNINKSNIIVEYKIRVTNEGKIAGYARKIVDYLPEDCMFSSEINNNWHLSDKNQNVYNTSLENEIINPGESKEVTLVLSFNITDKNIGSIINNNAEIYESYNERGTKDVDSITGNKVLEEDDMSKADIVLSVVTGKLVLSLILTIVVLALLVFGIYEIKLRVLTRKS